jgi:8-oxo-dGTP pyrophosphatase MutT (NUDIX family)
MKNYPKRVGSYLAMKKWKVIDKFIHIKNRWIEFIGEHCVENGKQIEYYSVVRSDSIVILVFQNGKLLLPKTYYRHGIKEDTLDFPGGRLDGYEEKEDAVYGILLKELQIDRQFVDNIELINNFEGWAVDSSFSSQKLYVAIVNLYSSLQSENLEFIDITKVNIDDLIKKIDCLQCKSALLYWVHKFYKKDDK